VNDSILEVRIELAGWGLFWADLEVTGEAAGRLSDVRRRVSATARKRFTPENLPASPAAKRMRLLFRAAGCDPTRYRPSSEALLRRIVRGEEIPEIHPLVDLSNTLSAELVVPCCVMSAGTFEPPFTFRAGKPGERYVSLRGPFNLEGKPLLCDSRGPLDSPITGNEKVKVTAQTSRAWLVAYLPLEAVSHDAARRALEEQVRFAPVVRILQTAAR
jgi:DNA/RNA-binding domain of Phe-tRNA-synthetase-like protein